MTVRTLTLGSNTLDLTQWQQNGIAISLLDIGAPDIREVVYSRSTVDGVDDQTQFFGQRLITMTGKCFNLPGWSRSKAWDLLQPFLDPAARATLVYSYEPDAMPESRVINNLRVSTYSKQASSPMAFAFQIQWKGDPIAYEQTQESADIGNAASGTLGRTYPRTFSLVYPTAPGGSGVLTVATDGTYKTWPIYRIYGPCTNPTVAMINSPGGNVLGQVRLLAGIPGGAYVEINSQMRTVMYNGPSGVNWYRYIDFANTSWIPMLPGTNTFRFTATSATGAAHCTILWNDAFLA